MKTYIKNGEMYDGRPIVTADGDLVMNPTEEMLLAAGYEEHEEAEVAAPVVREPTEEELAETARVEKLAKLAEYDRSMEVNGFSMGGRVMWLSFEERSRLLASVQAYKAMGSETMAKYFDGERYEFAVAVWEQMLAALEVYASEALNATEAHRAAIGRLETVEEIEAYDFTTGYPEKLQF